MPKRLSIIINYKGSGSPRTKEVEAELDRHVSDWVRFAPNFYVVETQVDPGLIYAGLKPLLHDDDSVLLLEVEIHRRWGWAPKLVVDWLSKHAAKPA